MINQLDLNQLCTRHYIFILFATKAEKKEQILHRNARNRPYSERNTLKGSNKRLYKTCEKIQ